jgi:poly(3-hydroxybutyrate) depolymerase
MFMLRHAVYGLSALMISTAFSQTLNVRGKVTDASSKAIAGAKVELLRAKKSATTEADGAYVLSGSLALAGRFAGASAEIRLDHGILGLSLARPARIRIGIFDARGNLLDRIAVDKASAGSYRFDLAARVRPDNLLIVKATVGEETKAFPYFALAEGAGLPGAQAGFQAPAGTVLAKVSAIVDTLQVTASGYAPKKVQISSYDSTVNVTLEASAGDRWGGPNNPPLKSSGCGKPALKSGSFTMTSAGLQRKYILSIPANYDASKPSRMIYGMHWLGGSMEAVQGEQFFRLQPMDAEKNIVFVAPHGYTDGSPWRGGDDKDHTFFEELHRYLTSNLCIDSSRVFMTGFSFGGMITYTMSTKHQDKIRASVGIASANYNIYLPPKNNQPIAWMQTTGMGDGTCPWVNSDAQKRGAKYIALEHAADNGCTLPAGNNVPAWTSGAHLCYDFQGCKTGYPVKACTFNGGHTSSASDPGSSANWIPQESWKFFNQF